MCYSCWQERDCPTSSSWRTRHVARLVARNDERTGTGGALHVLTDDWNTELRCVLFCLRCALGFGIRWSARRQRWAVGLERPSWLGVRVALWMLTMRDRTRAAVLARREGWA